ncbi:MAG: hypothetical protein HYZ53_15110 [Planctomycetes bacterium]|nr:hypothetical protein [Planctomycetota bacterium]
MFVAAPTPAESPAAALPAAHPPVVAARDAYFASCIELVVPILGALDYVHPAQSEPSRETKMLSAPGSSYSTSGDASGESFMRISLSRTLRIQSESLKPAFFAAASISRRSDFLTRSEGRRAPSVSPAGFFGLPIFFMGSIVAQFLFPASEFYLTSHFIALQ